MEYADPEMIGFNFGPNPSFSVKITIFLQKEGHKIFAVKVRRTFDELGSQKFSWTWANIKSNILTNTITKLFSFYLQKTKNYNCSTPPLYYF